MNYPNPTLWGFWHSKLGADKKLVGWGWGSGQVSEAEAAFKRTFPDKSLQNLTLTFSYTEEQYLKIAQEQEEK